MSEEKTPAPAQAPSDWWVCDGILPPRGTGQKIICQHTSSPHGVPPGAQTPGQAAYEAFRKAFPGEDWGPWDSPNVSDTESRDGWKSVAQAAIAAQEQPAPGDGVTPGQAAYEAYVAATPAAFGVEFADWAELDAGARTQWEAAAQAAVDATAAALRVCAEPTQDELNAAAREPHPQPVSAPEPGQDPLRALAARWSEAATLVADGPFGNDPGNRAEAETLRECARQLRDLAAAAPAAPQPAKLVPESELADAERMIAALRSGIAGYVDELKTSAAATHPSKKSQIQFDVIRKLESILEGK